MSPSGYVNSLLTNALPGPFTWLVTVFAANSRLVALAVFTGPLLLIVPLPLCAAVPSTGLERSAPRYSRIRISGYTAAAEKRTVTVLAPAPAA
jgi:hypothetical protein